MMTANLIVITNDVYDVAKRLKEIDSAYSVCYNKSKCRYEVHNSRQKGNTFCLVVPYDCLDQRTIDLVWRTRVQNIQTLLDDIERDNAKLQQQAVRKQCESALSCIEQGGVI